MSERPTISRMALSATAFTEPSGSSMLNRYFEASLITQNTAKVTSTMFSSPVSIRLSSLRSRPAPPWSSVLWPTVTRFTRVTLGV